MVGTVKSYSTKYGFGFITDDETNSDIFFSYRALNCRSIKPGTRVEYDRVLETEKGLKTERVTIIE